MTWRSGLAEWASRAGKIDGFRSEDRETRQQLPRPLAVGGLRLAPFDWRTRLADLSGGATWRSGLAEWASRAGKIDGFRSEDRETRQRFRRPLAVGSLSLADLIGGEGSRSGRAERDSSTAFDPRAERFGRGFPGPWFLAVSAWRPLIGGPEWRSDLALSPRRCGLAG